MKGATEPKGAPKGVLCWGVLLIAARCLLSCAVVASISTVQSCSSDQSNGYRCEVDDDCWNDPAVEQLGRCRPQVLCRERTCEAWCPEACVIVRADTNPCRDPSHICNEPESSSRNSHWFCTAHEIGCGSVDECPKYKPSLSHQWSCMNGVCRFPGFHYASESPD